MHLLLSTLVQGNALAPERDVVRILAQYGDEDDDDYYTPPPVSRKRGYKTSSRKPPAPQAGGGMGIFQNQRQMGASLLGFGLLFTFVGILLFFEGNLLRLGNICIISGIPLLVGPNRVRQFFSKSSRFQAAVITAFGVLLVFWGKPRLGILCEIFGLLNLFGNMFPLLLGLARRFPIVSNIIDAFESEGKKKSAARQNVYPRKRTQKQHYPEF